MGGSGLAGRVHSRSASDSSNARNAAILPMSSGSMRPIGCAVAIFVTRERPAWNRLTRNPSSLRLVLSR
jgi:hypothetical protein